LTPIKWTLQAASRAGCRGSFADQGAPAHVPARTLKLLDDWGTGVRIDRRQALLRARCGARVRRAV